MRKITVALVLASVFASPACVQKKPEPTAKVAATPSGGPTQTRPTWIKSPEAIEGTIHDAWGLDMTDEERFRYLQSIYSILGGTMVQNYKSLISQPNELFLLGIENLSSWIALKLEEKEKAAADSVFDGLGLSDADAASCFADDTKDWCDFKDGVTLGSLSAQSLDPATLSKEWRKRLMHNIQDVAEFMLLAVDNNLKIPGTETHAAQYLLDDVFLDELKGAEVTPSRESAAWRRVIYVILLSGGFFLEAPPATEGS